MAKLTTIEGIGAVHARKLKKVGVGSTDTLLDYCRTPKARQKVAKASGIASKQLLKFVNHADLMRIKGIGGEYSELLEASGVDTVKELKHRDAQALYQKMVRTNKRRALVRQVPSERMVKRWVAQAKRIKPMVKY
ncbi:MAG: DUF4332 domain-containing protein [Gemmatimonadota bacterium]|nr:MAG: DUF4332 domain-containing protein [Gemmatimonadota bacterium]